MFTDAGAVLEEVRQQLVQSLIDYERAEVTTTYVHVGEPAWDDICGQLTVGYERTYRSLSFPVEAPEREGCWGGQLVLAVWAVLVRCVPGMGDDDDAPTGEELDDSARALLVDQSILWNACADLAPANGDEWEVAGLTATTNGPQGQGVAIVHRWLLGLDQDTWCPAEP